MDKKLNENEVKEAKLQKKFNMAQNAFDAGVLVSGITVTATVVSLLMGGSAAIVSDLTMNHTAQGVYEQDAYHASIRERERQLTDDLINGKIGYEDFKAAHAKLYSVEEIINYSKTANDEKLTNVVKGYQETKDMQYTMFNKALPTFGTPTLAGAAVAFVAAKKMKKYRDELDEAQEQMDNEEEMSK